MRFPQILFEPAPPIAPAGGGGTGNAGDKPPASPALPDFSALFKTMTDTLAAIPTMIDAAVTKAIPPKKEKTEEEEITAKQLKEELDAERALSAVRIAAQAVTWFDPEEAVAEIHKRTVKTPSGYVAEHYETVAGQAVKKQIPLAQAVQALAKSRTHWVKTTAVGGTGATGSTSAPNVPLDKQITRKQLAEGKFDPATIDQYTIID